MVEHRLSVAGDLGSNPGEVEKTFLFVFELRSHDCVYLRINLQICKAIDPPASEASKEVASLTE